MKDYALSLLSQHPSANTKTNILREYLQAWILRVLHSKNFFEKSAFIGGTALRFLHQLPRYSEDLDFSLIEKSPPQWKPLMEIIQKDLRNVGYDVSLIYRDVPPIYSCSIRFKDLLYEAQISPHKNQVLSIKLELDTRPPKGAEFETKIISLHFPLAFTTHDLPTLFSGKIHAILARGFTKGRDYFDLGYYLSKWKNLSPNILFLKNALEQTHYKNEILTDNNWKKKLYSVIEKTDWKKVELDVQNFLERNNDRFIFTKENTLTLLK